MERCCGITSASQRATNNCVVSVNGLLSRRSTTETRHFLTRPTSSVLHSRPGPLRACLKPHGVSLSTVSGKTATYDASASSRNGHNCSSLPGHDHHHEHKGVHDTVSARSNWILTNSPGRNELDPGSPASLPGPSCSFSNVPSSSSPFSPKSHASDLSRNSTANSWLLDSVRHLVRNYVAKTRGPAMSVSSRDMGTPRGRTTQNASSSSPSGRGSSRAGAQDQRRVGATTRGSGRQANVKVLEGAGPVLQLVQSRGRARTQFHLVSVPSDLATNPQLWHKVLKSLEESGADGIVFSRPIPSPQAYCVASPESSPSEPRTHNQTSPSYSASSSECSNLLASANPVPSSCPFLSPTNLSSHQSPYFDSPPVAVSAERVSVSPTPEPVRSPSPSDAGDVKRDSSGTGRRKSCGCGGGCGGAGRCGGAGCGASRKGDHGGACDGSHAQGLGSNGASPGSSVSGRRSSVYGALEEGKVSGLECALAPGTALSSSAYGIPCSSDASHCAAVSVDGAEEEGVVQYFGLVVQGFKPSSADGCYVLKTTRMNPLAQGSESSSSSSPGGSCVLYSLTQMCAGQPLHSQLRDSWLTSM